MLAVLKPEGAGERRRDAIWSTEGIAQRGAEGRGERGERASCDFVSGAGWVLKEMTTGREKTGWAYSEWIRALPWKFGLPSIWEIWLPSKYGVTTASHSATRLGC